jgi:hypothetical protein
MSTIRSYIFFFLFCSTGQTSTFFFCRDCCSSACLLELQLEWPQFPGTSLKARSTPSRIVLLTASRAHATGPAARGCIPLGHKQSRNDFICQVLMDHTKPMKREDVLYSDYLNGVLNFAASGGTGGSILPDPNAKNFWLARASNAASFPSISCLG